MNQGIKEIDIPKYPENGVIYDGDYYRGIPYGEYLKCISLEDWRRERGLTEVPVLDIRDYGAVADGITLSTGAIQRAADQAGRVAEQMGRELDSPGAILYISGGCYITSSLTIHEGTVVFIAPDATLMASRNPDTMSPDAFLRFEEGRNVMLTGGGRIMGNGEYYVHLPLNRPRLTPLPYTKLPPVLYDKMGYPTDTIRYAYRSRIRYATDPYGNGDPELYRPSYTVWFDHCRNVVIENIMIEDAMDWSLVIGDCDGVLIRDVIINDNRHVANTDGIDLMNSRNVEIHHCFVSSADDGICIKSPRGRSGEGECLEVLRVKNSQMESNESRQVTLRNIRVSDCVIVSVMNGIKIGTETFSDIEDIEIWNCRLMLPDIYPGMTSGISIESCDGAHVRDIRIHHVTMEQVVCPVYIHLNRRNKFGYLNETDRKERGEGGSIRRVEISHIQSVDAEIPSLITGYQTKEICADGSRRVIEKRVQDIKLSHIDIRYRNNKEMLNLCRTVVENVDDYPESNAFGDLPAYGFYIRHSDCVVLEDVKIVPREGNTRAEIVREDTHSHFL